MFRRFIDLSVEADETNPESFQARANYLLITGKIIYKMKIKEKSKKKVSRFFCALRHDASSLTNLYIFGSPHNFTQIQIQKQILGLFL